MAAKKKVTAKKAAPKKRAAKKPDHPLMTSGKDWNREKVMDFVCDQLVTSSRGLGSILREGYKRKNLPSYSTIMKWLDEDKSLSDKYARAKTEQAEYLADEMLDIADDARNDWMEREDPNNPGFNYQGEHVQRARLRIETRKWLMGKLKPKKYGEKVEHQHEAGDGLTQLLGELSGTPASHPAARIRDNEDERR